MRAMKRQKRIGFLAFDGITALDLVGPAEAFAVALSRESEPPRPAYEVVTIGIERRSCRSESGVALAASCTLERVPPLDTLIVPGGSGLRRPSVNRKASAWI